MARGIYLTAKNFLEARDSDKLGIMSQHIDLYIYNIDSVIYVEKPDHWKETEMPPHLTDRGTKKACSAHWGDIIYYFHHYHIIIIIIIITNINTITKY